MTTERTRYFTPTMVRSRFMLELLSELVAAPGWDPRQVLIRTRPQGGEIWGPTFFASDSPDEIELVIGLLWADAGGYDSQSPVFDERRARDAVSEALESGGARGPVRFRPVFSALGLAAEVPAAGLAWKLACPPPPTFRTPRK